MLLENNRLKSERYSRKTLASVSAFELVSDVTELLNPAV